jgi:deoxyribonuclease IV
MNDKILIGAHLSISGGMEKAIIKARDLDINSLQIFTKNASSWKEKEITKSEINAFISEKKDSDIKFIFSHYSYLINLASPDNALWNRSQAALQNEIIRSIQLDLDGVILHPGQHIDSTPEQGLDRIAQALNSIAEDLLDKKYKLKNKFIILEITAGQGSSLGYRFEHMADILKKLKNKALFGICFDTAHAFAAGYDISKKEGYEKTFLEFDKIIGLDKLAVFHLNDSMKDLDSRVDRHEHLGKGRIGRLFFRLLMNDERFHMIPKIIETPKGDDDEFDRINLKFLKNIAKHR